MPHNATKHALENDKRQYEDTFTSLPVYFRRYINMNIHYICRCISNTIKSKNIFSMEA